MKPLDAIVVGAGPAGSTFAWKMKQAGFDIKIFDKKAFPRVKPCAGWITPQVVESLDIDLDEYRRENTLQPITAFRAGMIGQKLVEVRYDDPVSFGILRCEFDNYLLQRSGVPCEQESIQKIEWTGDRWQINDRYATRLLIGAGGHFCPVARYARKQNPTSESESNSKDFVTVVAQEAEFNVSSLGARGQDAYSEIPELYFCRDLNGYGWKFCKGEYINIGLGRINKTDLSQHVSEFCESLGISESSWVDSPPKFLGHAYRLYAEKQPFLFDNNLLLIGDAAGLAYPQSGEGIRPAIESALIAADVVIHADERYDRAALAPYAKQLTARLGPPQNMQQLPWLPPKLLRMIARPLFRTHFFAKRVVIENWFLNRKQAALKTETPSMAQQT